MSWSKSLSGTPEQIRTQLAEIGPEVKATDEKYSSSAAIVDGHQAQITRTVTLVESFLADVPDGYGVSGTLGGHTDGATSDQWNVSVSAYKLATTS